MKAAFRNATCALSRSLNPSAASISTVLSAASAITLTRPLTPLSSPAPRSAAITASPRPRSASLCLAPMASGDPSVPALEKQFEDFRVQLEESGSLRDRIRAVATDVESATRLMHSSLLLVHQSRPLPEVLDKAKAQIGVIKDHYSRLAEILHECPGQYYRYHGDWRSETQTVVSLLAFMHWLETGSLLMHDEAGEKLGLNNSEFGLDIEDYLIGVCFMSNELPRYVVNQVTAGDYDCPRKVLNFLTDLNAAFRMLNLRNDFLRKKFDSLKYDLRRVEEVFYDVKIRGLASSSGQQQ